MKETNYKVPFEDFTLKARDVYGSSAIKIVYAELKRDHYNLDDFNLRDMDVVIDIGAHIGLISMYIAKKYPGVMVFAYEPHPINYKNLVHNLEINRIYNVSTFNLAVTSDGRDLKMICNTSDNSGGATGNLWDMKLPNHDLFEAKSTTLDDIFLKNNIDECKLLKIDCEGSEHEIIMNAGSLCKIDKVIGEIHINNWLVKKGYTINKTYNKLLEFITKEDINLIPMRMAQ